ncbi:PRP3-domain-containing protein [Saccharata proteae CBS 121410]|uniref:PRP3-domain-containing protein n=1 Tax=Saccharata proteae CBS 121410 TaxID=1314787 RepID=A0A9P4HNX2_9PEZI|nr:PRP3-domain-containing protein [Saccharata proteae CBS 121410]
MVDKRPYPNGGAQQNDEKRSRSNNGSPAPPSNGPAASAKPDMAKAIAEARARAEAVKAKLAAQRAATGSPAQSAAAPATRAQPIDTAAATKAKMEAIKAKVAAMKKPAAATPSYQKPEFDDSLGQARGGLGIGLHPALMGDAGPGAGSKGKHAMQPKFATTMANRRPESPSQRRGSEGVTGEPKNPYLDESLPATGANKPRISRSLVFNQKGKYIAQASALRRQAQLEEMKRKLAEQAKRVALDEDNQKPFLLAQPPDVEWWDEGLVEGTNYNDLTSAKIDHPDSIITAYVQHPVLLDPPQEKRAVPLKPLPLTKTEQAKLRRQRRMADHKEEQAKIRLGLVEPPAPKVKKSNLMRVLGEQAVKDPTAVEARVNREIAERAAKHEAENQGRKLTKEAKHEKLASQQELDAAKGIQVCVFRVDNLSFGKHRYQVDINAKQNALTGVTILNPKFNLIIVEGGAHSIRNYKKLMLNRIKWTENGGTAGTREANREAEAAWLQSMDEAGKPKDLSLNRCTLVWEGEERQRAFRAWKSRVCETETEAKDVLSRTKMENMWTLAKSVKTE